MNQTGRGILSRTLLLFAAMLAAAPAFAQLDLTGVWTNREHEDQPERGPGPMLGDYLGLPINDSARQWALSWSASRVTIPQEQCRVHISTYIYRGPLTLRVWEERDPESQQIVAIRNYINTWEQNRSIWMDGRPHPPEYAAHTWMGFSTGKWEGDVLTVNTTHIKQGWIRRNGVPESDLATSVEHFIRHGDYLTHVVIITDPVYLAEPLIKSEDFVFTQDFQGGWTWPCRSAEEVPNRAKDVVPQYDLGQNSDIKDFLTTYPMVPAQAAMGGPETMYPEYRLKLKAMKAAPASASPAVARK